MASPVLHCFEEYQKARISFVQTIAEYPLILKMSKHYTQQK